ncbi:MAG: septation protein A [Kiloniellales bacterium]|nr:septation protein A [Kiloniellales bacterium]
MLDYSPLAAFFLVYLKWGLFTATAALIVVTLITLALAWLIERRIAMLPLITAGIVTVFGGVTLLLHDETYIKMKPTIVQLLFTAVLLGGLAFKRPLLKHVLGQSLMLDETGWRRLTWRWAIFFAVMAAANEAVWRTQSTDFWVNFKVFGILGITLLFALAQTPLVLKHRLDEDEVGEEGGAS